MQMRDLPLDMCDKTYMAQIRRTINKRFQEYIFHIRYNRPHKSKIANHILKSQHNIKDLKLVKHISQPYKLDAYESIFIHKNLDNSLNADKGPIPKSHLYQIKKFTISQCIYSVMMIVCTMNWVPIVIYLKFILLQWNLDNTNLKGIIKTSCN